MQESCYSPEWRGPTTWPAADPPAGNHVVRALADEEAGDYGDPEFLAAYSTVPDPE